MSKGKVGEEEVELMLKRQLFFLVLQPLPSLVVLIAVGGGKYQRWAVVKKEVVVAGAILSKGKAERGKDRALKKAAPEPSSSAPLAVFVVIAAVVVVIAAVVVVTAAAVVISSEDYNPKSTISCCICCC